jgi:hypothetical protein
MRRLPYAFLWCAIAAALAGVFLLYARPDFMVQIANQLWSCF